MTFSYHQPHMGASGLDEARLTSEIDRLVDLLRAGTLRRELDEVAPEQAIAQRITASRHILRLLR